MAHTGFFRRFALTALVCVLALGIFTLAHRAKSSQYHSVHTTGYLAKAVKMSGDRCQTAAVVPRVAPLFSPIDESPRELKFEPESAGVPRPPLFESIRNRPPPPAA